MNLRIIALAGATCLSMALGSTECRAGSLFVSSSGNDVVYQFDADTGATVRTFSAPGFLNSPTGLALSPDTRTLYVGNQLGAPNVHLFDTITGDRTGQFFSGLLTGIGGLALTADGDSHYVAGTLSRNVIAFDTATGTGTEALSGSTIGQPRGLHLAPDDGSIYIARANSSVVHLALPGGAVIQTFEMPDPSINPYDVVLSPDGATLYVSTQGASIATSGQILRYDALTGEFLGNWTIPRGNLTGLAITPTGSELFVADTFGNQIVRINTATGSASPFTTDVANLGGPLFLLYAPTAVPEPSSFVLAGVGVICLGGWHWWRRRMHLCGDRSFVPVCRPRLERCASDRHLSRTWPTSWLCGRYPGSTLIDEAVAVRRQSWPVEQGSPHSAERGPVGSPRWGCALEARIDVGWFVKNSGSGPSRMSHCQQTSTGVELEGRGGARVTSRAAEELGAGFRSQLRAAERWSGRGTQRLSHKWFYTAVR